MEPLKPISTIIDKLAIAAFLNEQYQMVCQAKLLKAGVNHSYHITSDSDEYVFRIYSLGWRTLEEIEAEVDHLRYLNENGIPVSYPIATPAGAYVVQVMAFEGLRYGVLFSFAKGDKLLTFGEDLHYQAGEMMAKMHQLVLHKQINRIHYDAGVLLDDTFRYLPELLPVNSTQYQFLEQLRSYLHQLFTNVKPGDLRSGIPHMDIWFDNMNIAGDQITLFDFDFCGNGWLAFDITYYIMQIHSTEVDVAVYERKKQSFLKGYESLSPIPENEKAILAELGLAVYMFYIGVQCKRFDNWTNAFLNELHLKRLIDLRIKRWFEFNKLTFK